MKMIDFWENAEGDNVIYYILEHQDRESRDKNWGAFIADPDWVEVKQQSEIGGPIVQRIETFFMNRVPYSPVS